MLMSIASLIVLLAAMAQVAVGLAEANPFARLACVRLAEEAGFARGNVPVAPRQARVRWADLFRLPALLRRFPGAQVVWMLRDATTVFHSNRKMWQSMFAEHSLSAGAPAALDSFLGTALGRCAEVLTGLQSSLPPQRWVAVTQSSLAADPRGTVARVIEQLGLEAGPADALEAALARTSQGRIEHYGKPAPPEAAAGVAALDRAQAALG